VVRINLALALSSVTSFLAEPTLRSTLLLLCSQLGQSSGRFCTVPCHQSASLKLEHNRSSISPLARTLVKRRRHRYYLYKRREEWAHEGRNPVNFRSRFLPSVPVLFFLPPLRPRSSFLRCRSSVGTVFWRSARV